VAIDSGSATSEGGPGGYAREEAFSDNGGLWGGRKAGRSKFYIGIACSAPIKVDKIEVLQSSATHYASTIFVEALVGGSWIAVSHATARQAATVDTIYEVRAQENEKVKVTTITVRLPDGHTANGLRGSLWGFNNMLFFDADGKQLDAISSSSASSGDLSQMRHLWLDKDQSESFWAVVPSSGVAVACATQGAQELRITV
jgi:hypothetical protein